MPKEAFKSIPTEKRERILGAAARLFAERGFSRTDVAEIASQAGVAKGSMYNYFSNKAELYFHVCRDGMERSRQAVYGELRADWDIYRQIQHIFRNGVAFVQSNPEYVRLYLNVSSSGMENFADKLTLEVEKHTADHLKNLLREGIKGGHVRPDLNVSLAAFLINSLYIMFVISLVSKHFQIRMQEYFDMKDGLDEAGVEERLEMIISSIKSFLKLRDKDAVAFMESNNN